MKGFKYLLSGLLTGLVLGYALGYLRFPLIENNRAFWTGFAAALALLTSLILLYSTGKSDAPRASARRSGIFRTVLVVLLVLGAVGVGQYVYSCFEASRIQISNKDRQLQEMTAQNAALKQNDLAPLMRSILEDVDRELKSNARRSLADTTIARIATLSSVFKPVRIPEGDSLSELSFSSERGQLLQALLLLRLDTATFGRIKRSANFAGADLRGADLKGTDLNGIHLEGANLKDADLEGANLRGAVLEKAVMWGAKLNGANLTQTNLRRANLSWAQLNEAILRLANLNGSLLNNAQLRHADLTKAGFQWVQAESALFNDANLTGVKFQGSNLTKANLGNSRLVYTDLRKIDLTEADLSGVLLDKALVEENWLDKLATWRTAGQETLKKSYAIGSDTLEVDGRKLYRFRKL